jgi:hypothetical protein
MTAEQDLDWLKIENEILSAFKNVKLENGIGYFEAGALDDYLQPSDEEYRREKAKDERNDWRELLREFSSADPESDRHCFMDAKGLRFYLPFLMMRRDNAVNSIMYFYISDYYKRRGYQISNFTETVSLLTNEQKACVCHFYEYLTKINHPGFTEEDLNFNFATGEITMQGFDFMEFIRKQFDANTLLPGKRAGGGV